MKMYREEGEDQPKRFMGGYLQQTLLDGKLDMMLKRHSFPFLKYTVNGSFMHAEQFTLQKKLPCV